MSDKKTVTVPTINELLDEKIPRDVISERDGGGGRRLSYLEGWYVIDRLNKVFGHLNWSKEVTEVRLLDTVKPSYLVKVRLEIKLPKDASEPHFGNWVTKEAYGYGSDKGSNNPHELAIKEAVTDALKVAAKDLGMSMGLALYDKTQEHVDDGQEETANDSKQTSGKAAADTQPKAPQSKETVEAAVRSYINVANAQNKMSKEEFKAYLAKEHKAEKLAQLSIDQLKLVLSHMQTVTK